MTYYNLTLTQLDIIKRNDIYHDIDYCIDKYKEPGTTECEKDLYNDLIRCKLKELKELDKVLNLYKED